MAILDKLTEFAESASCIGSSATTLNLGNQIDLERAGIDFGLDTDLWLNITVHESIITAGAPGTIRFQLVSDDTASIATNGNQSVHYRSEEFVTDDAALNDLDAGALAVAVQVPKASSPTPYERYVGVQAVITTTPVTAGAVRAFLTHGGPAEGWKPYAEAVS